MFWLEALSYLVTILGLPAAIFVFIYEHRRSRFNDENEIHRQLSAEYDGFLKLMLDHSDLLLLRQTTGSIDLSEEQRERRDILFQMLVSLFEKAYIILYRDNLEGDARRRWSSWEDDMQAWCGRGDFRAVLPDLLDGEDDAFSRHILAIANA